MLKYLRSISVSSTKLLLAAKALSADPNAPNVMNQLAAACRAVTDAINSLLDVCSTSGPGQKECDNALRNIKVKFSETTLPCTFNPPPFLCIMTINSFLTAGSSSSAGQPQ